MTINLPEKIKLEESRLAEMMMNSDEEITIEEFIQKYASEDYKKFLKDRDQRKEELWKQGIIED